jgi:DnaJ-class molecular chaperone
MATRNYYEILGVNRQATLREIKDAYRQIAKISHPDLLRGSEEQRALFDQAYEAYKVLTDPLERAKYDRGWQPVRTVADLLLRTSAGESAREQSMPHAPAAPRRGHDRARILEADESTLTVREVDDSKTVREVDLTINVPPDLGDRFFGIMRGLGDEGQNGAPSGDLVLVRKP